MTREQYFTARTILRRAMEGPTPKDLALRWEDRFHQTGDRLTTLAQSKRVVVQVGLAYGPGDELTFVSDLQTAALDLVTEEMKVFEAEGDAGLDSQAIQDLRGVFDTAQEKLMNLLIRAGSASHLLKEAWEGP
ncbi:hypothetical protein ANRL4_03263 [Anaerolineae bacterium]|nr:hypothetical protein ANRL4_03263 [Anaerolineae bacterium]